MLIGSSLVEATTRKTMNMVLHLGVASMWSTEVVQAYGMHEGISDYLEH
jgi:hypothetical protein